MTTSRREILEKEQRSLRNKLDSAPANMPKQLSEMYRNQLQDVMDELEELQRLEDEQEDMM